MPTSRIWDKHEIKAEIGRRGLTLGELSLMYGLSESAVRQTLHRKNVVVGADQAISDFLGVPLHVLWPELYDDRGHRLVKLKPLRKRPPTAA